MKRLFLIAGLLAVIFVSAHAGEQLVAEQGLQPVPTQRTTRGGQEGVAEEMGRYAVEVNLLGLLQFGPFVRFYAEIGEELFIAPHVRLGFAGALNYLLWDQPYPDIGAGASLLVFFPASLHNRLYAGGFTEASINFEGDLNLTGGANFGYRWRFPRGRYWNVGVIAGLAYNTWEEYAFFFGMFELGWGIEF